MKSLVPKDYHIPRQLGDAFKEKQKENLENAIISLEMYKVYGLITSYLQIEKDKVNQVLDLLKEMYKDAYE